MSRTMNSQALALLDRILGLSGPGGEQYTTLDDGNVQQTIDIQAIARRSLSVGDGGGIYTYELENVHTAAGQAGNQVDPYNFGNNLTVSFNTNAWPVPVPRGLDVWLIGTTMATNNDANLDWGQVMLILPAINTALVSKTTDGGAESQIARDQTYLNVCRYDVLKAGDFIPGAVNRYAWETTQGQMYVPLGMRLTRGTTIDYVTLASGGTTAYLTLIMGIFPEGLGQDIAT